MKPDEPQHHEDAKHLLTPKHAAAILQITPRTLARWAQSGRIGAAKTVGGHRRYRTSEIFAHRLARTTRNGVDGTAK